MKQLCSALLAILIWHLIQLPARGESGWLYAISFVDHGNGSQLVKINIEDGSVVEVGDTGYQRLNSLASDARGYLYSVGAFTLESSPDNLLLRIDPRTANAEIIADVQLGGPQEPDVRGLSFGDDGTLYATIARVPRQLLDDELWRIDPETGLSTRLATFDRQLTSLEGLTTSNDGTLYSIERGKGLLTLDPDAGTFVDIFSDDSESLAYSSLAFSDDRTLIAGTTSYFSIDLETGHETFLYDIGSDRRGIEFLPQLPGDFDRDGLLTAVDIELMTSAILDGSKDPRFDLNFDGIVDRMDRTRWVKEIKQTWIGDSNLDGEFSTEDIVAIFKAGQYEDGIPMNSTWETGDWDGDREFQTKDFVRAFVDGGYEQGPIGSGVVIPEPSSCATLMAGVLLLLLAARSTL